MSYNSSGIYTVPADTAWVAGQPVYADNYNIFLADLKKAVNLVINRLIESQMRGPLLMGGFKITNLGIDQTEYLALRYATILPTLVGSKIISNTINSYAAAAIITITGSTSPFLQIAGTAITVDTINAATADDIGPYYLLVREAGVEFSLAGNIRIDSLGEIYRTKKANMLFLMTRNGATGNWSLQVLEDVNALRLSHILLEVGTSGFSLLQEDGFYLLLE